MRLSYLCMIGGAAVSLAVGYGFGSDYVACAGVAFWPPFGCFIVGIVGSRRRERIAVLIGAVVIPLAYAVGLRLKFGYVPLWGPRYEDLIKDAMFLVFLCACAAGASLGYFLSRAEHDFRERDRKWKGLCARCSYDLRGCEGDRCPECGSSFVRAERTGSAGDTESI